MALTLASRGTRDCGLMNPLVLQQLAALLSADIAIHHREMIGQTEQQASPDTIKKSRSDGRNTTLASYNESKKKTPWFHIYMKKVTFLHPFSI